MRSRRPLAAVPILLAAALLAGCSAGGRMSPQARQDLAALRQMTEKVPETDLREQMLTRLASLETELTADSSPLARWLWPRREGVVKLEYHPFTCMGYTDETGKYAGIEVRVKCLDANGQVDRVRGDFRFELYEFVPADEQRKGKRLGQWEVSLGDEGAENRHWERHSQSYFFQLQYPAAVEPETKFVLTTMFTDAAGRRVFLEDVRAYHQ